MFLWILALHFVADFPAQSHWMAANKSKLPLALFLHGLVYTTILTLGLVVLIEYYPPSSNVTGSDAYKGMLIIFVLLTMLSHVVTDAITSRISGKLFVGALRAWDAKETDNFGAHLHDFFVIVGLDQLIHAATLYWTLRFLGFPV